MTPKHLPPFVSLITILVLAASAPAASAHGDGWHHGGHGGHYGWWWLPAGVGLWSLYQAPVYAYRDPYPAQVVVVQPSAPAAPTVEAQTTQYWYYCDSARAYYPYVQTCPDAWRPVPATPPQ